MMSWIWEPSSFMRSDWTMYISMPMSTMSSSEKPNWAMSSGPITSPLFSALVASSKPCCWVESQSPETSCLAVW